MTELTAKQRSESQQKVFSVELTALWKDALDVAQERKLLIAQVCGVVTGGALRL